MRYFINKSINNNFDIFCDNTLANRSYFIPYASGAALDKATNLGGKRLAVSQPLAIKSKASANTVRGEQDLADTVKSLMRERYSSKRVLMLSGEWDFAYFKSLKAMPNEIDTLSQQFDAINVPSCWSRLGYEEPYYGNQKYVFAFTPPKVPNTAVGVYRKKFVIDKLGGARITSNRSVNINNANKDNLGDTNSDSACNDNADCARGVSFDCAHILTFLGVSGGFCCYLNGEYLGYHEGSHNTAEFSLDNHLKVGENELVVVLYKWTNGTYLECQDMFRDTGIFRDVYITTTDKAYIYDYKIVSEKEENGAYTLDFSADIKVALDAKNTGNVAEISAKNTGNAAEIDAKNTGKFEVRFDVLFNGEKVSSLMSNEGKCKIEINSPKEWSAEIPNLYECRMTLLDEKSNELECVREYVGLKCVKIDGNRFLVNGKAIKMKGVNRHDTDPKNAFVMSASDIERDIALMKKFNVNTVRTSHYPPDPLFIMLCDVYGLYVVEEADIETHGANVIDINWISRDLKWKDRYFDRVNAMFMRDKNRASVVMWSLGNEAGGYQCQDYCYCELKKLTAIPIHYEGVIRTVRKHYDVVSMMYVNLDGCKKAASGKMFNVPYFLCEYCHAMGVGPGSFEDYWDIIYSSENMLGGCVWEFCDHAAEREGNKFRYTYSGDHGEHNHDRNFCADGLFFPTRKPSSGAYAMQMCYRPIRARFEGGKLILKSTDYFRDSSFLEISYEVLNDGKFVEKGIVIDAIKPQSEIAKDIKSTFEKEDDACINVIYLDTATKATYTESIIINCAPKCAEISEIAFEKGKNAFACKTENGEICINKKCEITIKNGANCVENMSILPTIRRALIDNYKFYKVGCAFNRYNKLDFKCKGVSFVKGQVVAKFSGCTGLFSRLKCKIVFTADKGGGALVDVKYKNDSLKVLNVPKFGVVLELDKRFCNVEYFGRGKCESYADMLAQAAIGIYRETTKDFYIPCVKPQDNGNRSEIRYCALDDGKDTLKASAYNCLLNFKADNINQNSLMCAKHMEDVKEDMRTNWYISGYMRAIGSNSCGPDIQPKYLIKLAPLKKYQFSFVLEIERKG